MLFDLVRRHSPTVERLRPRFLTTSRCRDVKHDNLGSVNLHYRNPKFVSATDLTRREDIAPLRQPGRISPTACGQAFAPDADTLMRGI